MLSVVVLVVDDEFSVSAKEPRGDAPVAADPHSPGALPFALERMKSKTGEPHIFRIHRGVQATQDQAQSIGMCGLEFGPGSRLEEADQILVLKAPDHGTRCNRYRYGQKDALRFSSPACASPSWQADKGQVARIQRGQASGSWQTASMLCPSGPMTNAA